MSKPKDRTFKVWVHEGWPRKKIAIIAHLSRPRSPDIAAFVEATLTLSPPKPKRKP